MELKDYCAQTDCHLCQLSKCDKHILEAKIKTYYEVLKKDIKPIPVQLTLF